MQSIQSTTLMQLREATRAEHRALETQPQLTRLLTPALTLQQYVQLLQQFASFYRGLEAYLQPGLRFLEGAESYQYYPRRLWLEQDLTQLAQGPTPTEATVPWTLPINLSTTVGVLYVIEGATLGGRVISGHLSQHLGLSASHGACYFNAWQLQSWSYFRHWVSLQEADIDAGAAIAAAISVFTGLRAHLDRR